MLVSWTDPAVCPRLTVSRLELTSRLQPDNGTGPHRYALLFSESAETDFTQIPSTEGGRYKPVMTYTANAGLQLVSATWWTFQQVCSPLSCVLIEC